MLWKKNKSRKESKECQGRGETISGLKVTLDPRPEAKREQAMWIFLGSRFQPKGRVGARGLRQQCAWQGEGRGRDHCAGGKMREEESYRIHGKK